jgi:hypothetical protein
MPTRPAYNFFSVGSVRNPDNFHLGSSRPAHYMYCMAVYFTLSAAVRLSAGRAHNSQNSSRKTKIGPNSKLCMELALTPICPRAPGRPLAGWTKGHKGSYCATRACGGTPRDRVWPQPEPRVGNALGQTSLNTTPLRIVSYAWYVNVQYFIF